MTHSAETSTEALLAHAGWMRALALGLVRDGHAADDVVQDAAPAAILGWVDAESGPFELGGAADELELALGRGGAIEGRVLVLAGDSAAGRSLRARPRTAPTASTA